MKLMKKLEAYDGDDPVILKAKVKVLSGHQLGQKEQGTINALLDHHTASQRVWRALMAVPSDRYTADVAAIVARVTDLRQLSQSERYALDDFLLTVPTPLAA